MAHNKLNPIAKKYGHHVHKKTADTESKSSLKKRLRDTQRILKRDLPATKRQELERRLEALTAQVGSMDQNSKENELQEKYNFDVETKKINRKITQLNKIIAEMGHSEEREAEMDALQLNLLYTTHFPRDIKYVSLYPKDDSETSSEMRTKILELIKKAKKSGEIEKEGFALRFNAPAAEPGIAVEETQDDFFM